RRGPHVSVPPPVRGPVGAGQRGGGGAAAGPPVAGRGLPAPARVPPPGDSAAPAGVGRAGGGRAGRPGRPAGGGAVPRPAATGGAGPGGGGRAHLLGPRRTGGRHRPRPGRGAGGAGPDPGCGRLRGPGGGARPGPGRSGLRPGGGHGRRVGGGVRHLRRGGRPSRPGRRSGTRRPRPAVTASTGPVLAVRGLHAGWGPSDVVRGVDLEVASGEVVAILGGNGSGKSSLLLAVAGLLRARAGAVELDGRPVGRLAAERRARLGLRLLPQTRRVFPSLTVRENLEAVE